MSYETLQLQGKAFQKPCVQKDTKGYKHLMNEFYVATSGALFFKQSFFVIYVAWSRDLFVTARFILVLFFVLHFLINSLGREALGFSGLRFVNFLFKLFVAYMRVGHSHGKKLQKFKTNMYSEKDMQDCHDLVRAFANAKFFERVFCHVLQFTQARYTVNKVL